jgi:hypothetical protein
VGSLGFHYREVLLRDEKLVDSASIPLFVNFAFSLSIMTALDEISFNFELSRYHSNLRMSFTAEAVMRTHF